MLEIENIKINNKIKPKKLINQEIFDIKNCHILATNDHDAIQSWLNECHNHNTFRSYTIEARRFLIWCIYVKGLNIVDLKKEDYQEYFDFLQKPGAKWKQIKIKTIKNNKNITIIPFKNNLSGKTLGKSIVAINALINYLSAANYISYNPIALIKKHKINIINKTDMEYTKESRILEDEEWEAIINTLDSLPTKNTKEIDFKYRTQFIFFCLYFLGLRAEEFVNHNWNSFVKKKDKWWFYLIGKGGKKSHIPVHDKLLEAVVSYRRYLKYPTELPSGNESSSFIKSSQTEKGLCYSQIYNLIKKIAKLAANKFDKNSIEYAKLQKFSPHWIRHIFASHLNYAGVEYKIIQRLLRHSSESVTDIYIHNNNIQLQNAINKLNIDIEYIKTSAFSKTLIKIEVLANVSQYILFDRFLTALQTIILKKYNVQTKIEKSELNYLFKYKTIIKNSLKFEIILNQLLNLEQQLFLKEIIQQAGNIRLLKLNVDLCQI